jgi:hypothetical protein
MQTGGPRIPVRGMITDMREKYDIWTPLNIRNFEEAPAQRGGYETPEEHEQEEEEHEEENEQVDLTIDKVVEEFCTEVDGAHRCKHAV